MFVRTFPAASRLTTATAVLAAMLLVLLAFAGAARAEFGIVPGSFQAGQSVTTAGAPTDVTVGFDLNLEDNNGMQQVSGTLKDVIQDLPAGLIGDPTAAPRCTEPEFLTDTCPVDSQIGVLTGKVFFGMAIPWPTPLYNMVPPKGKPAMLAGHMFTVPVHLMVTVRDDGDYGLHTELRNLPDNLGVSGATVELWGVPADPSHDNMRGTCLMFGACPVASTAEPTAFMRNGSQCGPQSDARVTVTTWTTGASADSATHSLPDITACDQLPPAKADVAFSPDNGHAGAPTGMGIVLDVPRVDEPNAPASPPLKSVSIALPEGMALSPGAADGLGSCADAQLHADSTSTPVECPDASKIGTVKITTPLLPDPLTGAMYLGTPQPGDQFRLFLVAEGSGVHVRLRGSAVPDPQTGRLTTTFEGLPPLAFSKLEVDLKGGPRGLLVSPAACGTAAGSATVTPFGGGAAATAPASIDVSKGCDAPAFTPDMVAGSTVPLAGGDSPFVLQVRRQDGQQDLKAISVDLPAGLIGKVAGVPLCPTAAAIAGTCGDASRVGSVTATVGTGSHPVSLPGSVYLTEGYGGPFGLAFVVPAKIGPFDFGNVVVRAKVQVDQFTGALHVETDALPSIVAGIPMHYRSVTVNLDREGFMRNPTSCLEQQLKATLTSASGAVVTPAARFQVAGCAALPLAPKVKMSFNGAKERKKGGKPGLSVVLSQTAGQSNLKTVKVTLPKQVGIALGLPAPCTVEQFTARDCPAASKIGDSSVTTPLLDGMLQGGVYLVTGDKGKLPRLGVLLNGQVPISLLSTVRISHGRVVTTFPAPDLPISQFKLTLNTKTALATTADLCKSKQKVNLMVTGATGAVKKSVVTVPVQGCPSKKAKKVAKKKPAKKKTSKAALKQ